MRIYLTGFMGAGKTAVGRRLASLCGARFIDLDNWIEQRAGATIPELFARRGEAEFRRLEAEALAATAELAAAVVATGGGLVVAEENRAWLAQHGVTVWLNPAFSTLLAHLSKEERAARPLFEDEAQAEALWRSRLPAYAHCDLEIAVAAEDEPDQIAARIATALGERRCAT